MLGRVPDLSDIVFLLFLLFFLVPMVSQRLLATRRYRAIRSSNACAARA